MNNKSKLIQFLISKEGKEKSELTWNEILLHLNIPVTHANKKWASDIWRYYKKKNISEITLPKILIFDIETCFLKGAIWRLWKQNIAISQLFDSGNYFMLTWSAKWLGSKQIMNDRLTSQEAITQNDKRITESMWKLFDEADIVIAHYGDGFDIPMLNNRFIMHDLIPPSFYKSIDTKKVASRYFKFPSNKLDYLAKQFGVGKKLKTDFELWDLCSQGNEEALKKMSEYNDVDVIVLEKVYLKLRPYIKSHPNLNIYTSPEVPSCSTCGSINLKEEKEYYTNSNKYETFRCVNCGAISRKTKGNYPKDKKEHLLTSIAQ